MRDFYDGLKYRVLLAPGKTKRRMATLTDDNDNDNDNDNDDEDADE